MSSLNYLLFIETGVRVGYNPSWLKGDCYDADFTRSLLRLF